MGYKVFVQIGLIIISIVIGLLYIKPTFVTIGEIQDETYIYQEALSKTEDLNRELNKLVQRERSFSAADKAALDRFLPETVDIPQVMRDIEAIYAEYDLELSSLSLAESGDSSGGGDYVFEDDTEESYVDNTPPHLDFSLSMIGSYDEIKIALALLESNAYPLEIVNLELAYAETEDENVEISFVPGEEEFSCDLVLRVFSQNETTVSELTGNFN